MMKTSFNPSLQLLINVGMLVDFLYGNCTSSDRIQDDTSLLEVVPPVIKRLHWKNLLIITDYSDPIFLSIQLSRVYIHHSIISSSHKNLTRSLQYFNKHQLNNQVLILCSKSCIQHKTFQDNLFDHRYFWLLIYSKRGAFVRDSTVISEYLRPDSQIYALTPDNTCFNKWLVVKLKPKTQFNNEIILKRIARINSGNEIHWINEKQKFCHSLHGYNFTAVMFHWPPMSEVIRTKDGISVSGIHYNLMLIYSRYLGFTFYYDVIYAKGDQYDSKLMTVWNLQRHKLRENQVTMSGMFMPITSDVLILMRHSSFVFSSRSAVIFKNIKYHSQSQFDLSAYSKPFTSNVWICVFLIPVMCLVLSFVSSARSYTHKNKLTYRYFQYWYEWTRLFSKDTLTPFPSQGLNYVRSPATSKKIFTFVLLLFTVLVTVNYGSILTSFLAAELYKIPFEMLEDLINDGRFIIGTLHKSSMDSIISNSKTGVLFAMQNKSMYGHYFSMDEAYRRIVEKKFAAIIPIEFTTQLNCSYAFLKTTYLPFDIAVNFPKSSPYVEIFSKFIMRMRSAGILHKVVGSITSIYRPQCEFGHNEFESVNLAQSVFPFLILFPGTIFAFLIFICEVVNNKVAMK